MLQMLNVLSRAGLHRLSQTDYNIRAESQRSLLRCLKQQFIKDKLCWIPDNLPHETTVLFKAHIFNFYFYFLAPTSEYRGLHLGVMEQLGL